jgi:predicted TIM-barrel fold metal-dependent hydrolase
MAGIDPYEDDAIGDVERCLGEWGFKGISINPGWLKPPLYEDDQRFYPIYEVCQQRGGVLTLSKSMFMGPDFSWARVDPLVRVARDFPNMQILISHGGFPYVLETLAAAFACGNVWISPDLYGYIPNTPGAHEFVRAAHYYLADRLLFASCYPVWPMQQAVDCFQGMGFTEAELDKAFDANPRRLLGIKASPSTSSG